jgi:hypothetical protein
MFGSASTVEVIQGMADGCLVPLHAASIILPLQGVRLHGQGRA